MKMRGCTGGKRQSAENTTATCCSYCAKFASAIHNCVRCDSLRLPQLSSSFSGNEDAWYEHDIFEEHGGRKKYFHQPKTGEASWEKPQGVFVRKAGEGKDGPEPLPKHVTADVTGNAGPVIESSTASMKEEGPACKKKANRGVGGKQKQAASTPTSPPSPLPPWEY